MIQRFLLLGLTSLGLSLAVGAQADVYPILQTYKTLAQQVLAQTQSATTPAEIQKLKFQTRDLITYGQEIAHLYASKNPNCSAQLTAFIEALPAMADLELKEIDRLYHGGEGLPVAPKHCYMGRSQSVHPMMNLVRLQAPIAPDLREEMIDEIHEVIEHLARIQRNLDNPPN